MKNIAPNTPVIICAGQYTQHWQEGKMPLEPLRLIAQTFLQASQTLPTAQERLLETIDSVFITNIFGYQYADAPTQLSEMLGLQGVKVKEFSTLGGNTPQSTVNRVCRELEAGKLRMALLAGGEANYSLAKMMKNGIKSDWTPQKSPQYISGENKLGSTDLENNYELFLLTNAYPIFETALRHKLRNSPTEHQAHLGKLYAPFSEVAKQNPFAWQQTAFSAEEIYTPSPDNRYIAYPYTKRMCANNQVDQVACLLLTTQATADELQVPQALRVYPVGGADLHDIWDFACRPDVAHSEAIGVCAQVALEQASLTLADIDAFDLYSCFPVAVQAGKDAIGILPTDTRPPTITGGLAYFGGAWNNYSMHAIVQAVENIRRKPQNILLNALGWYITKHAVGIYSSLPTAEPTWNDANRSQFLEKAQQNINEKALPAPVERVEGLFEIVGYTLLYDRDGSPKKGVALVQAGKTRAWTFIEGEKEALLRLETEEWVGKQVAVQFDEKRKRNFAVVQAIAHTNDNDK